MDAYTLHLLGMAAEVAPLHELSIWEDGGRWQAEAGSSDAGIGFGDTLADALAALLRDLGVEVPERPTAERMQSITMALEFVGGDRLAFLRSVDRLALLALLEED